MNTLKSRLTVVAAFVVIAALGMSIVLNCGPQRSAETSPPDNPVYPVLKIDGKEDPGVYLQSLDIQVEVSGNITSTRQTMVFKNKTDRVMEGELTFPLPEGRTVTYYALDINGKMREAVAVEKASGTQIFEEIEQRRRVVDPGLLERVEGNNFRTRIYPIPANGTRTIAIGYEEELTLENERLQYRLPTAYPYPIETFSIMATVLNSGREPFVPDVKNGLSFNKNGENYIASFVRKKYMPPRELSFALFAPAGIPQVAMQSAQGSYYFLASVTPKLDPRKRRWDNDIVIIWDVSLSGSQRNLTREIEMLNIIFAEKKTADVNLYFLNNKNKHVGNYKVTGGKWDKLKSVLDSAVFDGGTDFSQINMNDIIGNEILFFSDGISTLSDAYFSIDSAETRPIHCVVSSAKADYGAMRLIAERTNGKFLNINALSPERLKSELLYETPLFLGAEHGELVREVYPSIAAPVYGNFSISGIADTNSAEITLLFGFDTTVETRMTVQLDAKNASNPIDAHNIWAQKKITELELDYYNNRAELAELGQRFGIVTRNTSLIVLENVDDYVRYGVAPPASENDLYAEYQRRTGGGGRIGVAGIGYGSGHGSGFGGSGGGDPTARANQTGVLSADVFGRTGVDIDAILSEVGGRKGAAGLGYGAATTTTQNYKTTPQDYVNPYEYNGAFPAANALKLWRNREFPPPPKSKYPTPDKFNKIAGAVNISAVIKNNGYLDSLTGKAAEDYKLYLKMRKNHANAPTFYFDMANWFYSLGDKETAIRVLTSIADLELENASLYRLLGYRLKEYGEYALEKFVCGKALIWRPMEPQSYRDYALALADNGETQAALDRLYAMLAKTYPANIRDRSRGIEEVVVTEINRLIAKDSTLNTSNIDKRIIIDIPVDIRVVINWNMNSADINLHVKDPNNEECSRDRRETSAGGRLSADIKDGYGPEQFLLKKAARGKYRVYVNYYGDRQVADAGPATVMAEIYTKYADATERRQVVCVQMSNAKKRDGNFVEIAEFEF